MPGAVTLKGHYGTVERIDAKQHGPSLWAATRRGIISGLNPEIANVSVRRNIADAKPMSRIAAPLDF